MPISPDPNKTTVYYLEEDKDKPEAERRGFVCRFMSVREHERIGELIEAYDKAKDDRERLRALLDMLRVGVTGWQGFDGEYSEANIKDSLTPDQLQEVAVTYPYAVRAAEIDLKNSRRASSSSGTAPTAVASPMPAKSQETTPSSTTPPNAVAVKLNKAVARVVLDTG